MSLSTTFSYIILCTLQAREAVKKVPEGQREVSEGLIRLATAKKRPKRHPKRPIIFRKCESDFMYFEILYKAIRLLLFLCYGLFCKSAVKYYIFEGSAPKTPYFFHEEIPLRGHGSECCKIKRRSITDWSIKWPYYFIAAAPAVKPLSWTWERLLKWISNGNITKLLLWIRIGLSVRKVARQSLRFLFCARVGTYGINIGRKSCNLSHPHTNSLETTQPPIILWPDVD